MIFEGTTHGFNKHLCEHYFLSQYKLPSERAFFTQVLPPKSTIHDFNINSCTNVPPPPRRSSTLFVSTTPRTEHPTSTRSVNRRKDSWLYYRSHPAALNRAGPPIFWNAQRPHRAPTTINLAPHNRQTTRLATTTQQQKQQEDEQRKREMRVGKEGKGRGVREWYG